MLPTPIRSILAAVAGLGAVALIAGWGLTRVVTDEWGWTQWVWWVPSWVMASGALALLVVSRVLRALGARKRGLGPLARGVGWVGLVVMVAWMGLVEWRYWAWPLRWVRHAESGAGLRVAVWNQAWNSKEAKTGVGERLLMGLGADVIVLSNPRIDTPLSGIEGSMGEGVRAVRAGVFAAISKWPVVGHGSAALALGGRILQFDASDFQRSSEHVDHGSAAYFVIDTTEVLGRPIVVWAVDLPSDPSLSRAKVMRQARGAIGEWAGPERRLEGGRFVTTTPDRPGFPAPDLIVGDFNTPRGSGSLRAMAGEMPDAFSQAGMGMDASWPRKWPLVHIDQMFVGAGLRASAYEVVDPGESTHRMQVAEIVADK